MTHDELLAAIADAKERRLLAFEGNATVGAVALLDAEIVALRAQQRAEYPEDFASKDTDAELVALRTQQVAELTALPHRQPWQERNLTQFATELARLKGME